MLQGIGFSVYSAGIGKAYTQNGRTLGQAVERLATGLKVNKAADDAAGAAMAATLESSIRGYDVAERNIGDALSLVQTAESGLSDISSNLQDIRALVVQAGDSSLSGVEKQAIQSEINQKLNNIDDIASDTSFNGISLLDGSSGTLSIQTSADGNSTSSINLTGNFSSSASASSGNINESNSGGSSGTKLNNINVVSGNLDDILTGIDNAIDNVSAAQSSFGAKENGFTSSLEGLSVKKADALATRSRIMDTNYAIESSNAIKSYLMQGTSITLTQQADMNARLSLNLLPLTNN